MPGTGIRTRRESVIRWVARILHAGDGSAEIRPILGSG